MLTCAPPARWWGAAVSSHTGDTTSRERWARPSRAWSPRERGREGAREGVTGAIRPGETFMMMMMMMGSVWVVTVQVHT